MQIMDQLPMLQLYKPKGSDELFYTIQEAAMRLGAVKFNRNYSGRNMTRSYGPYKNKVENHLWRGEIISRPTLFKEIDCVHAPLPDKMLELVRVSGTSKAIAVDDLGALLYEAMYKYISENWDSKKIHLMSHSSGYDSRTVSIILKNLRDERGEDWLGQMYFVCWEPEIADFEPIMYYQGWKPEQLILVNKGMSVDYYAEFMSFDYVGQHCSEADRALPQENIFNAVADRLCPPEELQVVTGNHADEVMDMNWVNYGFYFLRHLSDTSSIRNRFHSYITPYTSYDVLSILIEYDIDAVRRVPTKLGLLKYKDPELAKFVNFTPQAKRKKGPLPCELLSKSTVSKMESDLKNSWFYKTFKPGRILPLPKKVDYQSIATKIYIRAAICEYLINKGVNIK